MPGIYVIFGRGEVIYVRMVDRNGKGSLRKRLREHSTGQVVNMFAQYMLFNRLLDPADLPRSPQEAGQRCRANLREYCEARALPSEDGGPSTPSRFNCARKLAPTFNAVKG